MARYDEDIYDNPFFISLEKENQQLYEKATANRWVICVPKFAVVKNEKLTKQDFLDHILTPDSDIDGAFVTVSKQKVEINNGRINLGSSFKNSKVDILFEETFYNVKDESYRVVCVSAFFNREPPSETSDSSGADVDLSRPPVNLDECIKLLWGHQGSHKTRDSLDKALKIFCGEYQRFDGTGDDITDLVDLVSSHVTKSMQIVLKDKHLKKQVHENDLYMASLRIAVETYMMNAVHKHLFSTITACVKSADAQVNKMTRNLAEIRLHHLEVRREFEENLPMAKKELARLNQWSTPLGRMFCLKRVVNALTKPLFKSQENEDLVITSDVLLPLLMYLIIKSQIPNWMANLTYMKYFQMVKVSETEEFSFYLATTEAALDYIKAGNVKEVKPTSHSKDMAYNRQTSGSSTSSKEKFFQYVQYGDEAAVSLMLKKTSPTTDDVSDKLCHPLCTCEKCSEITARSSQNSGAISPIARDDNLGRTALHIAAFHGQASLIDILAKHGCLIDGTDYLGCTPLHLACQKGYQNIILLLVHFGADIGTVENEGNTPLHLCAKNGHEDCVKAILFLDILKNKLNVNAQNDMGDTPLHLAAKWGYDGIVNFLLESEADPRIRNRKRQTPLNVAQNPDMKKELLRVMKDPPPLIVNHPGPPCTLPLSSTSNNTPHTPSSPCSTQPTPDTTTNMCDQKSPLGFQVVDVIPVKSSIQMLDNSSSQMMSPTLPAVASLDNGNAKQIERLFKAIANKDLPLVKYYFGWVDSPDNTPSPTSHDPPGDMAASLCHPLCQCEKCQHIQKHSSVNAIDINCRNQTGWSPLHKAISENNMEVLDLLLKKGAYVNVQTRKRVSPLHLACYHNNLEMVEKLVQHGANVNLQDQHGEIPLHLASAKACKNIVSCLLKNSSTINLCNIEGYTPLHHAVCISSIDVVQLLLDHGAIPDIVTKQQKSPISMATNPIIADMLKKKVKEHPAVFHVKPQSVSLDIPCETNTVADVPSHNSRDVDEVAATAKSAVSPDVSDPNTQSKENDILHKIVGLDTGNVTKLKQIGEDIHTFDKQKRLKRSQTFDHTHTTLNSASLKLSLSIQHFDKQKSLKRTPTFDKSSILLKSLEHSSSIQQFDAGSLKHVDPVDKSSPMHIYSLVRSYSSYHEHLDTPDGDGEYTDDNDEFSENNINTTDSIINAPENSTCAPDNITNAPDNITSATNNISSAPENMTSSPDNITSAFDNADHSDDSTNSLDKLTENTDNKCDILNVIIPKDHDNVDKLADSDVIIEGAETATEEIGENCIEVNQESTTLDQKQDNTSYNVEKDNESNEPMEGSVKAIIANSAETDSTCSGNVALEGRSTETTRAVDSVENGQSLDEASSEAFNETNEVELVRGDMSNEVSKDVESTNGSRLNTDIGNIYNEDGNSTNASFDAVKIHRDDTENVTSIDEGINANHIVIDNNCDTLTEVRPIPDNVQEIHDNDVQSMTEKNVDDFVPCAIKSEVTES